MSKYILSLICALSMYMLPAQMQQLSTTSEISVLTIDPGTNLNDAFGHSAFRVTDDTQDLDIVFNYGVYDFDTPNFYTKFAQGKLNYRIAANPFKAFFNSYKALNRSITEQVLNLSQSEKQNLFNALLENYKPENQYYLYDFFYNNCATKIKDVLNEALNGDIVFNLPENFESKTFRSLIYEKVNSNSWGSLGIDIALGSVIDKTATPEEHMFLPQFIHDFFEVATYNNQTLIKQEYILFENKTNGKLSSFMTSPLCIISIISGFILWLTYRDYKQKKRSRWLDITLFVFTGVIGIFILLLWFATDHSATANNYNLLWAFVLNILMIGQLLKTNPKPWFIKYLKFLVIMLCLMGLHWLIGIQVFAITLLPFVLTLLIRYVFLIKYYKEMTAR